jgi:cytochrome c-type biogenesis protein CcmH
MSSQSLFGGGQDLRGTTGILILAASVCVLAAGIGAATSYLKGPAAKASSPRSGSSDDSLTRLKDYTRSIGVEVPASKAAAGKMLPDVHTMVDRLAARLASAPGDGKGWRTLGWSYFHMARYKDAANAYAKAVELDPDSHELKLEYEEAKARAAEGDSPQPVPPVKAAEAGKVGIEPSAEQVSAFQAMPAHDRNAAIRSMVDGLAARLENSPRDAEGWTRLMRSRVVLGEKEVAVAALRKALDVFKDDAAASSTITAAASELGLKVE